MKFLIGERFDLRIFRFPDDGSFVSATVLQVLVDASPCDVELAVLKPFRCLKSAAQDTGPRFVPDEVGSFFGPVLFHHSSTMLKTILSDLHAISNAFCDLVLGPEPCLKGTRAGGEIVEVFSDDPCLFEEWVQRELRTNSENSFALLGFEASRFKSAQKRTGTLIVMPALNGLQLIYAARELLLSNAVDVIVIYEILLRSDVPIVIDELSKLHRVIQSSNAKLVLLNPNTIERKRIMSELDILCSRQISLP